MVSNISNSVKTLTTRRARRNQIEFNVDEYSRTLTKILLSAFLEEDFNTQHEDNV